MSARMALAAIALVASFGAFLATAEDEGKLAEPVSPEILSFQPVKVEQPDTDPPALGEIYQLQRARYNVALEELKLKFGNLRKDRISLTDMLDSFKRFRTAERGLPGRPRVGESGEAAEQAWVMKEVEFFQWLEWWMQLKFDAEVAPREELLEVQFYHLDAKERLGTFALEDQGASER